MSVVAQASSSALPSAQHEDRDDDDDYPSSESDAEIDSRSASVEAQRLLAPSDGTNGHREHPDSSMPVRAFRPGSRKRRTPLKWTELIWITCTLSLIAVLGYSSQLCIMLPYYHKTPSFSPLALAGVLVPFNLGLLGIFYNYYLCVSTDPGSVPPGWQPEWSALEPAPAASHEGEMEPSFELKQAIFRPRYCKTCSAYKPPRSHHCKTCGRCVLRMDHHCPWLANCVGHYNYAHFLRFLFYVDVTCAYHLLMVSARVLDRFNSYSYWREPSTRELVWLVVNYALCLPVLLLVGIFSAYHFYCTAINQTTIESWEKDRTATMVRRGRIRKVKYPYNLGTARNVRAVLGENPLTWCLPLARAHAADGLKFPVAPGLGKWRSGVGALVRSHRSRHWHVQTSQQDAQDAQDAHDTVQLNELHKQAAPSHQPSWREPDDETYVDPELEASVLHRLRWENWHRQQAVWRQRSAYPAPSP